MSKTGIAHEGYQQGVDQATDYWNRKSSNSSTYGESVEQNTRPQRMRYESFIIRNELENSSVLDVGCGAGDFLYHLQKRGIQVDYTGTDISEKMIETCVARFPEHRFVHQDITRTRDSMAYDHVVSFGIHNIRIESGWTVLEECSRRQFDLCRKSAHISILTDRYTAFDEHIQSWQAERILEFALSITPYVSLHHDYLPNDFSVTLHRQPLIDTLDDLLLDYD